MAMKIAVGLLKPISALTDQERPIVAVKILPTQSSERVRRRCHLALILDVSGSMQGGRLLSVKETLQLLIGAMEDGDCLTLISYESTATNVAVATELNETTRKILLDSVEQLAANGCTNLEAALLILRSNVTDKTKLPVDSVFILTDGHINRGVIDPKGLQRVVESTGLLKAGVPFNTLGYGAEHNSRLLRDIAVKSRGTYTYADTDELLPTIIGDILAGVTTEFGRNAKLAIPDGWRCLELGVDETNSKTYQIGTLIAEKPQWIVLEGPTKLQLEKTKNPEKTEFKLTWKEGDVEKSVSCLLAENGGVDSDDVSEQLNRARVARGLAQVSEMLSEGKIQSAKESLEKIKLDLKGSKSKDRSFCVRLAEQVEEMHGTVDGDGLGGGFVLAGGAAAPSMAAIASRAASNAAVLSMQRGVYCMQSSESEQFAYGNRAQLSSQSEMKKKFSVMKASRK